ncbi:MAG: carbohydrate-binding family 9-like protein [Chryseolinea sp.]
MLLLATVVANIMCACAQVMKPTYTLFVKQCQDFTINGKGDNHVWSQVPWIPLVQLDSSNTRYRSEFKILYSPTGIYVVFNGNDNKITTMDYKDFDPIFNGDVFEVFFHPDPSVNVYYEYEVNAMGKEFILAISNLSGHDFQSWIPKRTTVKKMVDVKGGAQTVDADIKSWSAEIFFPFAALGILPHTPPSKGSEWHANFCRLDYDSGKMVKWSFTPNIKTSFHELGTFYTIKFD